MTPEEAFTGKRPEVSHIRIFGCLVYCHVPAERTKLEPTTEKGILVGYIETSKAYNVYIPALKRTMVRRDVRFEEDRAYRKSYGQMLVDEQCHEQSQEQSAPKEEVRQPLQTTCPQTSIQVGQQQQQQSEQGVQHEEEQDAQFTPAESSSRRRPKWAECTLREAQEQVEPPQTSIRMSRVPQRFSGYMDLMSELIEAEPSSFQEASEQ
jgi:hypothetical protein